MAHLHGGETITIKCPSEQGLILRSLVGRNPAAPLLPQGPDCSCAPDLHNARLLTPWGHSLQGATHSVGSSTLSLGPGPQGTTGLGRSCKAPFFFFFCEKKTNGAGPHRLPGEGLKGFPKCLKDVLKGCQVQWCDPSVSWHLTGAPPKTPRRNWMAVSVSTGDAQGLQNSLRE